MILFTLQEQKSHLINLSLNLCWEFVTDVNETIIFLVFMVLQAGQPIKDPKLF